MWLRCHMHEQFLFEAGIYGTGFQVLNKAQVTALFRYDLVLFSQHVEYRGGITA